MKKVVVASLLAVAGMACVSRSSVAQAPANPGANAQSANSGVQMSPAEYAAYNSAITQTTPQAKAPALESYLTTYPQSAVKAATLEQLMLAYSAFDPKKTVDAADRLLQVDPNNLRALTFEVFFRKQDGTPRLVQCCVWIPQQIVHPATENEAIHSRVLAINQCVSSVFFDVVQSFSFDKQIA